MTMKGDKKIRLWYKHPARNWNEALPLGNGRLGAMVFGSVFTTEAINEIIQLNEDTLWYKSEVDDRINPKAREYIPKIRKLLADGQVIEAEKLVRTALMGCPKSQTPYVTLGDLHLSFQNHRGKRFSNYIRELDIEEAIVRVSYELGGVLYQREIFSSATDQVLVIRLTANKTASLSITVNMTRRPFSGKTYSIDNNTIGIEGMAGPKGVKYSANIKAVAQGGKAFTIGDHIIIENADAVTLLVAANTDYYGDIPSIICKNQLDKADQFEYDELKGKHKADYQKLFNRVSLSIWNDKEDNCWEMPTDERLERLKQEKDDLGLVELYFHFGRYLLISSSRPGTMPANLQGIWNNSFTPPWESKYTININTQMNYWPAEICNLTECHTPLLDFIEKVRINGGRTAQKMYGCRGFVAHHNLDGFADTAPVDENYSATCWPMGGAWLCLHLWEHYCFTLEKQFLVEKAYPIIVQCIEFYIDYLVEDDKGRLLSGPSVSPENRYIMKDGTPGSVCMAPSMDSQILSALFDAFIKMSNILDVHNKIVIKVLEMRKKIPPILVGKYGQIMEWLEDYDEEEPGHRHISQLFALFPGREISPGNTPHLAEAAKVTLQRRLAYGGGHTGWSRAWIINFWARLLDSQEAYSHILQLLKSSTLPNLFDNHPPFQIDGNFGGTAAIAEMLLQSHNDEIHLLPALPNEWRNGLVKGLCARGGYEIDISWEDGKLKYAVVRARTEGKCNVRHGKNVFQLDVKSGENMVHFDMQ